MIKLIVMSLTRLNVLVTGAAGFIGSHLSERLLEAGHLVIGVDCFSDYYDESFKRKNIKPLLQNHSFTLFEDDLSNMNCPELVDGIDAVIHLAAQPGVRNSWGDYFQVYAQNNIVVTQRLLEACSGSSIKRFVFASSSSVYGDSPDLPLTEDSPVIPVSPYGVTKLAAEKLCYLYHKNFDVPTLSLRYFTVFGPRQRADMAFHRFLKTAMENGAINIFGDGTQTRDFTYVDDIVAGTLAAMESPRARIGSVYNLGGGNRKSVNEVIDIMKEVTGKDIRVNYEPSEKGDVIDTLSDSARAQRDLDFSPATSLVDGIRKEYEWVLNHYRS